MNWVAKYIIGNIKKILCNNKVVGENIIGILEASARRGRGATLLRGML